MDEASKKDLMDRVEAALDLVRPALQADGGDCQLVDVGDDHVAQIAMLGHCGTCPIAQMTLRMGIERTLMQHVPEIQGVESVPPQEAAAY